MIEAVDLTCERGDGALFRPVFSAENGTLLRIAGPNGTGKTSLLRMMCGCWSLPAARSAEGRNIRKLREEYWKDLAYIGHLNGRERRPITVRENLRVSCVWPGARRPRRNWRRRSMQSGWWAFEDSMARFLSQGQRRRVALARLYVSEAVPLWILDGTVHRARRARRRPTSVRDCPPYRKRRHCRAHDAPGSPGGCGASQAC